jgi:hypothetical protein
MLRLRALAALLAAALLSAAAPLAGLVAFGRPLAEYLRFPPRPEPVAHAPFDWLAFGILSVPALAALALFAAALIRTKPEGSPALRARARFPWWGWLGLALAGGGWVLAWAEGLLAPGARRHTFSVLWLGYIVALNALTLRRAGHAPLTHRTAWFLSLFPASAAAWWLFEHLNQFAGNWHYAGVEASGDWDYFLQATLPFSTVLPAMASTWALLRTFPRMDALELPAVRASRTLAWIAVATGVAALAGLGLWPELLFPSLWLAPALIVGGLQPLLSGKSFFAPLARGDWRCVLQPAAAALICGFFWELWNYGSLAKWHYSIPWVQRFHLFEMPLLGYAGYLPFGVACALVMDVMSGVVGPTPGARARGRARRRRAR